VLAVTESEQAALCARLVSLDFSYGCDLIYFKLLRTHKNQKMGLLVRKAGIRIENKTCSDLGDGLKVTAECWEHA
jgi:hypothetical protein